MAKKASEKELILRGANGILYRIPYSVLGKYVIPPAELKSALQILRRANPPLAAPSTVQGHAPGEAPQVVINVFTSPGGASVRFGGGTAAYVEECISQQARPGVKPAAADEEFISQQARPGVKAPLPEEEYISQQARPAAKPPLPEEEYISLQARPGVKLPEKKQRRRRRKA
jgi:hypothetical protein